MPASALTDWVFFRRLLIVAGVATACYVLWKVAALFMLFFAAALIAVLLTGSAAVIARWSGLPRGWALALSSLLVGVLPVAFLAFFGSQVAGQVTNVFSQLPGAVDAVGGRFGISDAWQQIEAALSSNRGGQLFSQVASLGYTAVGIATDLVLVVVTALYLAADPRLYQGGLVKLFPPAQHARLTEALGVTASALRLWFLGQLVSMLMVGVLCSLAFWTIGLPSPLGLGIVAGLTNFVPLIGPIIGAAPAVLFAFTEGTTAVLLTLGAVLVVQQLEGNLITPIVQQRAVEIPPALILLGISAFGALAGPLGIVLAVPLTVVLMVLIQKLWIRDTLQEQTSIPGEG